MELKSGNISWATVQLQFVMITSWGTTGKTQQTSVVCLIREVPLTAHTEGIKGHFEDLRWTEFIMLPAGSSVTSVLPEWDAALSCSPCTFYQILFLLFAQPLHRHTVNIDRRPRCSDLWGEWSIARGGPGRRAEVKGHSAGRGEEGEDKRG